MPEMKNLTINGKTYEVMDEIARNAINNINVPSDLSTKLSSAIYKSSTPSMIAGELAVGTVVQIKYGGVPTNFIVVQQGNPNTSLYDSGADGTWLIMEDLCCDKTSDGLQETFPRDESEFVTYCDRTVYLALDERVRNAIQTVKIPRYLGTGNSLYTYSAWNKQVFLPSTIELGSGRGDGAVLEYFKTDYQTKRIAYYNGTATPYWTRTAHDSQYLYSYYISASGAHSYGNRSSAYGGIRPMFVVSSDFDFGGTSTLVDSNGNEIIIPIEQIYGNNHIVCGSYVGSGYKNKVVSTGAGYNWYPKVNLTFDFKPKLLIITYPYNSEDGYATIAFITPYGGWAITKADYDQYRFDFVQASMSGNTISFLANSAYNMLDQTNVSYYSSNPHSILNTSGAIYDYIALG